MMVVDVPLVAAGDRLAEKSAIPGVGLVLDYGRSTGSNWGGVTADLLART